MMMSNSLSMGKRQSNLEKFHISGIHHFKECTDNIMGLYENDLVYSNIIYDDIKNILKSHNKLTECRRDESRNTFFTETEISKRLTKVVSHLDEKNNKFSVTNSKNCLDNKLKEVLTQYEQDRSENTFFSEISEQSKKAVLLILPSLSYQAENIIISIDSTNGNINIDAHKRENNVIISIQVVNFDEIYFSCSGMGSNDLFSITGMVEIDSELDAKELNRIFGLL